MSSVAGLIVHDDAPSRQFEPFALTRPIGTLLAGVETMQRRWEIASGVKCTGLIAAAHLADFDEAPMHVGATIAAGTIVANSRFAPALEAFSGSAAVWMNAGRVVAVRIASDVDGARLASGDVTLDSLAPKGGPAAEIIGWWMNEVWDFIGLLPEMLTDDIARLAVAGGYSAAPSHVTAIGKHPALIATTTTKPVTIDPHVVLDTTAGPIVIREGAHIHAFTRIIGPCHIGRDCTVMGGDIKCSSIGDLCKIRGEISSSIFLGYSNKGHEGFVGHSYLGRWVNLGAGTTTSNLKNTYGDVAMWTPAGLRDTRMQFLGTLFGDHVKTGIGTMINTGTVLGAAANVFGAVMPPKAVPPFAWGAGEPYDTYALDRFLSTAETVMARRGMVLSNRAKNQLTASFAARWNVAKGTGAP